MSVQIVEKSGEGLSRVFGVVVPKADLAERLDARIREMAPKMNIKGFRPGKVPAAHVRRMYGRDLMGEIVQKAVDESTQEALSKADVRPAGQPEIDIDQDTVNQAIQGSGDLAYEVKLEVMPDFQPADPSEITLTRLVHTPSDEEIDSAVAELAAQNRTYAPKTGKAAKVVDGDMVVADFIGRIDGEPFEGGTAEGSEIIVGSGRFIPGFEEQLVGAKKGETRTVSVTFPEEYPVERLKGRAAEFEVTVQDIRSPEATEADDALAERLGLENLETLRERIKERLAGEYGKMSRFRLKRALLDELDSRHDFPLPPRMVEAEFEAIWNQVQSDRQAGRLDADDAAKSEDDLRIDYRKIAERRVRLGLVLAEMGRTRNVQVSDSELSSAIQAEARRYPGQEREVWDFYQQNPQAAAQLRAPIFEEKVVEALFAAAKVEDREVPREELFADDDLPEGYGDDEPHVHAAHGEPDHVHGPDCDHDH